MMMMKHFHSAGFEPAMPALESLRMVSQSPVDMDVIHSQPPAQDVGLKAGIGGSYQHFANLNCVDAC
jgi:hypothetical protein